MSFCDPLLRRPRELWERVHRIPATFEELAEIRQTSVEFQRQYYSDLCLEPGLKDFEYLPDGSGVYMLFDNTDGDWDRRPRRLATEWIPPEKRRAPTPQLRFRVFQRDNFTCVYCGREPPEVELSPDHVIPFSKGGLTVLENLATCCRECNAGKSDEDLPQ